MNPIIAIWRHKEKNTMVKTPCYVYGFDTARMDDDGFVKSWAYILLQYTDPSNAGFFKAVPLEEVSIGLSGEQIRFFNRSQKEIDASANNG